MKKLLEVFFEMPCLVETSSRLDGIGLQKKWFKKADKRVVGQFLHKFVEYNSELFHFLGVQPRIQGTDQKTFLDFRSSEFVGTIPLRSPDTGKQIGDFVVTPRFVGQHRYEGYIEILNLLGTEISPQFVESLPLASGRNFRPPFYLEAVKFIAALERLTKTTWRKFDSFEVINDRPIGRVNWNRYVKNEYKVENRTKYPIRKNILNEFHEEYAKIRYVFDLCKRELLAPNTPFRIKNAQKSVLEFLTEKLYFHEPVRTYSIMIRSSDSPAVRACKAQANRVLDFDFEDSTAWKVDFSDVFEKFIQHIFKETSKEIGGKVSANIRFKGHSASRYSWELSHIEPDAVYQKNGTLVLIDAKYKSHLFNKNVTNDFLKSEHRRDLHQVFAYSAFSVSKNKCAFLCYPSNKVEIKKTKFTNPLNQAACTLFICGFPLDTNCIKDAKLKLAGELYSIDC